MAIDAVTAPPAPPPLQKLQVPVEAVNRWVDQWISQRLQHFFPHQPSVVWGLQLLIGLLATVLLAWLVSVLCVRLSRLSARFRNPLAAALLGMAAPTLRWMVLLAGLSDAIEDAWPAVKGPVRWVAGTLYVLSAIVATRGAVRLLRLVLDWVLQPSLEKTKKTRSSEGPAGADSAANALLPLVQRMAALMVWLIGLILVLDHFGQNVSSVVAAFGVTSLAIGLAAQQALSNIIAGLVLAVDHPFRPGDRIKLAGGENGEVLETGMRSTHIRLADGTLLVVPNADLVSSRLVNQSTETLVRAEVKVSVPASLDVEKLAKELSEVAVVALDPDPLPVEPKVYLLTVAEKLELSLILWLPRGSDVPAIEERLRRAALKRIQPMLPATPTTRTAV